jgi:hypothetical protein
VSRFDLIVATVAGLVLTASIACVVVAAHLILS